MHYIYQKTQKIIYMKKKIQYISLYQMKKMGLKNPWNEGNLIGI